MIRRLNDILRTHDPWLLIALAVIWLVLAFVFVSLAIDSGNMLEWLAGIFFVGWAVSEIVRAVYYGSKR